MLSLTETIRKNTLAQLAHVAASYRRAQALKPNGFSLDAQGNLFNPPDGYVVAERTYSSLNELLLENPNWLGSGNASTALLGYWKNSNGVEYFERSQYFKANERRSAIVHALRYSQEAIYNYAIADCEYLETIREEIAV